MEIRFLSFNAVITGPVPAVPRISIIYIKESIDIMDNAEYRVHRFEIDMNKDQGRLEQFLNSLKGEVVTIIPGVEPTFKPMGATAKVKFLLIIEKTAG